MKALIERIRARIAEGRATDHPGEWLPVQPPVAPDSVAEAERILGFRLPELLRRLYIEVGNGGFGPIFGLIPLFAGLMEEGPGEPATTPSPRPSASPSTQPDRSGPTPEPGSATR
jgi:hypothetical protein